VIFAILGSGFGLYGYLPALIAGGRHRVLLPERYRDRLKSRSDIRGLLDIAEWRACERQMLDDAEAVIIARRPSDQVRLVEDCLQRENIQGLVLEKPLAPAPDAARRLIETLQLSGKRFRIGYTLRYTDWARRVRERCSTTGGVGGVELHWSFRAHHYAQNLVNWKRFHATGGGALRFYGVHIIALLAEIGYLDASWSETSAVSPDEAESWRAVLKADGLPDFTISIDTNSPVRKFKISTTTEKGESVVLAEQDDPFDADRSVGDFDPRTAVLARLCEDFCQGLDTYPSWYRGAIDLWVKTELRTESRRGLSF